MHINVSRAYFHAKAQGIVLVRLPVMVRIGADGVKIVVEKDHVRNTGRSKQMAA